MKNKFEKVMKEADEYIKVLKSDRKAVISKDDIINLSISLNTINSVDEFLKSC